MTQVSKEKKNLECNSVGYTGGKMELEAFHNSSGERNSCTSVLYIFSNLKNLNSKMIFYIQEFK